LWLFLFPQNGNQIHIECINGNPWRTFPEKRQTDLQFPKYGVW